MRRPRGRPLLVGIVNITANSFSDGGRFLDPAAAIAHARRLAADGADIVELGAAASNVAAGSVSPDEEIGRLDPVLRALAEDGTTLAVDTYRAEVQRFALSRGVAYLNDIRGFPDPAVYPALAACGVPAGGHARGRRRRARRAARSRSRRGLAAHRGIFRGADRTASNAPASRASG